MAQTAVIIGAGIVGLHVANVFHEQGYEVYVLERDSALGEHSSGRNSGVIHAGIFYQHGSVKEKTCIEGNRLTYEWLERLKVPHRRSGKWIVPEEGQEDQLEPFYEEIKGLPIPTPSLVRPHDLKSREPNLWASHAIDIPSTGVVDAAAYVKALAIYLQNKKVQIILNCDVRDVSEQKLITSRGEIYFDRAVNCAGLFSDEIADIAGASEYEIRPCRGDYYIISDKLISRPVYHLLQKETHSLGVHLTPTLDDQTLLGPNAFFIEDKCDYRHQSDPNVFEQTLKFYLPDFRDEVIHPAYSGNRPKLFYRGEALHDFTIVKQGNWVHFLGIESPGLTAAPALAKLIIPQ